MSIRSRGDRYQDPNDSLRIDGRVQNDPATQAGMRGIHRGMSGQVIGGYTADRKAVIGHTDDGEEIIGYIPGGEGIGTKRGRKLKTSAPAASPTAPTGNGTAPATGNVLNARQNLFKSMEKAGTAGISPAMREQARSLGVTDQAFNESVSRIGTNSQMTPAVAPTPPVVTQTAPPVTPDPAQASAQPAGRRINPLTGIPFGAMRETATPSNSMPTPTQSPSWARPKPDSPLMSQAKALSSASRDLESLRPTLGMSRVKAQQSAMR